MPDTPHLLLVARILTRLRIGDWRPGHSPAELAHETGAALEDVLAAAADAARRHRMDAGRYVDGPESLRSHLALLGQYLHAEARALRMPAPPDRRETTPERCAEALARAAGELGESPMTRDMRGLADLEALRADVATMAQRATLMLERGDSLTPAAIDALRTLVGHAVAVEWQRFKQEAAHAR